MYGLGVFWIIGGVKNKYIVRMTYNMYMVNRLILILSLVVLSIVLAILFLTSPATIGPLGILFFFVLVYFLSFGVITFFMKIFVRIFNGPTGQQFRVFSRNSEV